MYYPIFSLDSFIDYNNFHFFQICSSSFQLEINEKTFLVRIQ